MALNKKGTAKLWWIIGIYLAIGIIISTIYAGIAYHAGIPPGIVPFIARILIWPYQLLQTAGVFP